MIHEGQSAPEFSGLTESGETVSLASFRGRNLVIYFYPKDDTPGCTKEACTFRDLAGEIAALGGAVLGVSMDTAAAHGRFRARHGLNFPLLADTGGQIAHAFGVARLGNWLGDWMPARRVTFIIDGAGVVRRVLQSEFDMGVHTDGALSALRDLAAGAG